MDVQPVDSSINDERTVVNDATRFVGIDLASTPARTGVVTLDWSGSRAHASLVRDLRADDEGLTALVDATTVVGLDAPLGWPDDFVAALDAHHALRAWPSYDVREGEGERERLRLRKTDLFVRDLDLGSTPLSVSSDLIGVVAMRAALLQSRWAKAWGQYEARDGSGRLVETYPAAALRAWKLLPRRGVRYKGGGGTEKGEQQRGARESIAAALEQRTSTWLVLEPSLRHEIVRSDHALDALVCALVALAATREATHVASRELTAIAAREGWIHVPSTSLEDLGLRLAP